MGLVTVEFVENGHFQPQKAGNALLEALYGVCLDKQQAGTMPARGSFVSWATSFEQRWSENRKLVPFYIGDVDGELWLKTTRAVIKQVERMFYEPILITGSPEALARRQRELEEVSDGW